MKVLLLNGSPHAQGCTYTALCEVAGALERTVLKPRYSTLAQNRLRDVLLADLVSKQENVCLTMVSTSLWKRQNRQMALFLVHRFIMQMHPVRSAPFWIVPSTGKSAIFEGKPGAAVVKLP